MVPGESKYMQVECRFMPGKSPHRPGEYLYRVSLCVNFESWGLRLRDLGHFSEFSKVPTRVGDTSVRILILVGAPSDKY